MAPPSSLSAAQAATFRAGEEVVGQSGCLACHVIGDNGNNGPGPPLTTIGLIRRPQAIASTLRNPTAPMPSFAGLAKQNPQKFNDLVTFLSELQ
jgi:menaquinol-cytochrome c reductase cytochrome b/c subunit